jgi:hypothetical protein
MDRTVPRNQRRGVTTQLLEYEGTPPVVYGELKKDGATRTVLFYAHYDGSPSSRYCGRADRQCTVDGGLLKYYCRAA